MWRAEVQQVLGPGWVLVTIPKLFGTSLVGPMQSSIEPLVGERVIVADLTPQARSRDWWVVGYESMIGRWGEPYPHEHPIGQVTGLNDALAAKADADALAAKVDASVLTGKADAPGPWEKLNLIPAFTTYGGWANIQYRFTVYGLQLRGLTRLVGEDLPLDTVIGTIPGLSMPGELDVQLSVMGPGPSYVATNLQLAIRADGTLRTRQTWLGNGVYSFAHTIPL